MEFFHKIICHLHFFLPWIIFLCLSPSFLLRCQCHYKGSCNFICCFLQPQPRQYAELHHSGQILLASQNWDPRGGSAQWFQFLLALLFLASTSPLKLQCKPLLLSCTPQTLPEKVLQCHQSLLGWNVWEVVCSKTWASESNRLGSSSQEVCLCSFRLLVGKVETVVVWRWVSMARAWLQAHGKYSTNIDNLQPMPPFPVMILDTTQPNPVTLQTEDTRPLSESSGLVTQCRVAYSQPAEPQRAEGTCPCSQILDARPPCTALPLITKALPGLSLIHSATPPMPFMN